MIASPTSVADPWAFQAEPKQRVSNFFKGSPHGTYDEFLDKSNRNYQIGKKLFDEVHLELQRRGVITIQDSGKNIEILRREVEADLIKRMGSKKVTPDDSFTAVPPAASTPIATDDGPANLGPQQSEPSFPNATAFSTPNQEISMAKPLKISELTTEQRDNLIKMLRAKPDMKAAEAEKQLGVGLVHTNFSTFRYQNSIGQNRLSTEAKPPKATPAASKTGAHVNGSNGLASVSALANSIPTPVSPLVWNGKLHKPVDIGKGIPVDGYKEEAIKAIQEHVPSFLAEAFDPRMQFKVLRVTEDDGVQKTDLLKIRRVM